MTSPFTHHPRGSMTPQRRAKIFAARDGRCGNPARGDANWGCSRKLGPSDYWQVEHDPALERGGVDDDEQCFVICEWCIPDKDADDHATAGHMRRSFTRHVVPGNFRKGKGWR